MIFFKTYRSLEEILRVKVEESRNLEKCEYTFRDILYLFTYFLSVQVVKRFVKCTRFEFDSMLLYVK